MSLRRNVIGLVLALLAAGAATAYGQAGIPARYLVPHPCFVPANPLKKGMTHPVPEKLVRMTPGAVLHTLEGAGTPYHSDHLREDQAPLTGPAFAKQVHLIAIMVDFSDQPMGSRFAADAPDSARLYAGRVLDNLASMYDEMSGGAFEIRWDLAPTVYRLPQTMAWYGLDDSIGTREGALCRDAVRAADPDVDFGRYDRFLLIHAGGGQEADINNDSLEEVWSVFFRPADLAYYLPEPDADRGIRTADRTAAGDTVYVNHMVITPEYESQDGYDFGEQGVVCHEFGHSFGLPDLYDTTGPADFIFADSQGIGAFGLMGSGIWNDNGYFPAEMCAWSKYYVGWLRPTVYRPDSRDGEQEVAVKAVELARRTGAVRIPMGGDEYLLIENRKHDYNGNGKFDFHDVDGDSTFGFWTDDYQGAEYDWWLPTFQEQHDVRFDGSGLLVWHVDESIVRDYLPYNLVNSDALHKGVDLEEADGIQDLDKLDFTFEAFGDPRDSYWAGNATEFTPDSNPSSDAYNDARTGIWITGISAPDSVMTFKLRFTSPGGNGPGDFRPGWPRDLAGETRDFQPVVGDLDGDGRKEIVVASADTLGLGGVTVFEPDGSGFRTATAAPLTRGNLRSGPILANLDPQVDALPELIWVSGDTLYAYKGTGVFLRQDGALSPAPAPFYLLAGEPGRVHLTAGDLDNRDGRPEVLVSYPAPDAPGWSALLAVAYLPGTGTSVRTLVDYPGSMPYPGTLADVDTVDSGLKEIATSVRTGAGGYLAVSLLDERPVNDRFAVNPLFYSAGDSVSFTPPVVGDLNRDGIEEIVVADSRGFVHAFDLRIGTTDGVTKRVGGFAWPPAGGENGGQPPAFNSDKFAELSGFPVQIGALGDDALSLADVDGDGYLEVLAFGPVNQLYVINYNGTFVLTLPVGVPGEDRFTEPFLAPLVADVTGTPAPEFLLPLPDGQVRAHTLLGRPIDHWSYLGGGNQGSYPQVADLDGDGDLELVTVEDVTVSTPAAQAPGGDDRPNIVRTGRVLVREVGEGTGAGPWPVFRHDAARSGRSPAPTGARSDPAALLTEAFAMPNPAVATDPVFHYRVRSDVQRLTIEVRDLSGRAVRSLNGSVDRSTDNEVRWDRTNDRGNPVAPGLYLVRFRAEAGGRAEVMTARCVVVR